MQKDVQGEENGKDDKPKNQSWINKLYLDENVAGERGSHTTVSVLEPVMWIERTIEGHQWYYRIVCRFDLQVKIHAFEKGLVTAIYYREE